jgi:hypothetical protein
MLATLIGMLRLRMSPFEAKASFPIRVTGLPLKVEGISAEAGPQANPLTSYSEFLLIGENLKGLPPGCWAGRPATRSTRKEPRKADLRFLSAIRYPEGTCRHKATFRGACLSEM